MNDFIFDTLLIKNGQIKDLFIHKKNFKENAKWIGYDFKEEMYDSLLREVIKSEIEHKKDPMREVKLNIFLFEDGRIEYKKKLYEKNINRCLLFDGYIKRISAKRYLKDNIYIDLYKKNKRYFKDFLDVILVNEKSEVCEGLTSNIFFMKDNVFYTPEVSCGLYDGVTKERFIKDMEDSNFDVRRCSILLKDIFSFERCLITSSLKGIIEVEEILFKNVSDFKDRSIVFKKCNRTLPVEDAGK